MNSASACAGKVYIETYGCSFNVSDSEVMAGLLERAGYDLVLCADLADVVILNSCTVKDRTYLEFRKRVDELGGAGRPNPALILAGCVPRIPAHAREFAGFSQLGPDNVASVVDLVDRALAGERAQRVQRENAPRLTLPKRRRNPAVEIVPISKGCLGSCTFCQTVLARGRLYSYPEEEIVAAIESALSDGVRQVWLTSQDCAAYGMDRGTSLPRLLRRIGAIPGDFRIRVGMANPDFMKLFVDEFADALADPRFYRFAHIPVQSGSDRVLAEMARDYTAEDFRRICDRLRTRLPGITVATDIIAGFPTETDADFAATLDLLRDTAPPVVNRSRYSPRPGTRAARLTPLPSRTVSQRSRELLESARRINRQQLAAYVGWKGEVVVETCPKPGVAFARDPHHNPVVLHGNHMPGECVQVTVTGVEGFHLCGKMGSRGASRRTE